jgi:NAD(P)-dependent dehydrogenase (short-subunit alcohol dehydrogenase family)
MQELRGKVAVVTGGASGIGLAMVQRFAQEGMTVVAADVREDAVEEATEKLRAEGLDAVHGAIVDVTDYDSVDDLAHRVRETHGDVHVLCNNAGVGSGAEGFIWEHELADWSWGFDVNIWGVIHGIRAFVPAMVGSGAPGHVVNTSSGNGGVVPFGDTAVYATTKAAVVTITESLYAHLLRAESSVRASVLFPGPNWLRTGLWEAWRWRPDVYAKTVPRQTPYPSLDQLEEMMENAGVALEWTPLEEVADVVVRGIRAEQFWMLPASESTDASIRARAASMLERKNPEYFREWKPPAPPARPARSARSEEDAT